MPQAAILWSQLSSQMITMVNEMFIARKVCLRFFLIFFFYFKNRTMIFNYVLNFLYPVFKNWIFSCKIFVIVCRVLFVENTIKRLILGRRLLVPDERFLK